MKSELKSRLVDVVRIATIVHEGRKQRIPTDITVKVTYYGKKDVWVYHSVYRANRCQDCKDFQDTLLFGGKELITKFPYHTIQDADLIYVNVHPNCRCKLTRLFPLIGKKQR